jgi:hypothetical protein
VKARRQRLPARKDVMQTGSPDPIDTASLALEHDTPILAAALVCRLALDDRTDDADQITRQLSSLFSGAQIGLGALDTDTPGALAHAHDTATLASALVGRVALDGKVDVATKLALLLRSINIDTQDDHTVDPSAHCHRGACEVGAGGSPAPPGVDADAWRRLGPLGLCLCSCAGCRTMPRPLLH